MLRNRRLQSLGALTKRGVKLLCALGGVLVLGGIVTAMAVPGINRFMRSIDLNKQVQQVASMFRVARQRAILFQDRSQ